MKSFITNAEMLFKVDTGNRDDNNFDIDKKQLIIPKYQREYQWSDDMILTLLNDIKDKKKFLGIVILDQMQDSYEIVDGQQRLTTCFLTLAAIYNLYENDRFERQVLEPMIERNNRLILENSSVGNYLIKNGNKYELFIDENSDIYFQKDTFENAWKLINEYIKDNLLDHDSVRSFKSKLLACDFLILINSTPDDDQSVEQVFLDINEKSKILNPANIFKGHCFELFDKEFHDELKNKWARIKAASKKFERYFRYRDTSWFLYMYLLMEEKINENLSFPKSRKHYLQGKAMGEVDALLTNIIAYGENVADFYEKCKVVDYYFETVCQQSYEHRNTNECTLMKKMSRQILEMTSSKAQFQKIPFMYFISMRDKYVNDISHEQVRRIVTNLYCYAILFEISSDRKSKEVIDKTVIEYFKSEDELQALVRITKALRDKYINNFSMLEDGNRLEKLADIYSLMDFYDIQKGIINNYYSLENEYNLEHLVVNDNNKVQWLVNDQRITIQLDDEESRKRKKRTINYILINDTLNGELESFDIITKIEKIREWHRSRNIEIPKHVNTIIEIIEGLEEFEALVNLKENGVMETDVVKTQYTKFLDKYFDTFTENNTLDSLKSTFKASFR